MRAIFLMVLLLPAGVSAQAQEDPARIVQTQIQESARLAGEWLGSPDPRVRAWGASVAARDGVTAVKPRLVSLAVEYAEASPLPDGRSRDDHESMLSVLDALIQLDGRIPLRAAARLYEEFPAPSLIFLSHGESEADAFLLEIFRKEDRAVGAWLTAGNILMTRTPAGFAAQVLGGFTVDARIRVLDEASAVTPSGGFGASCSSGSGGPRAGWPPVGNYYVSQRGTLLSTGTVPTFYLRVVGGTEPGGRRADFACDFMRANWDWMREHFLARLARESPDAPSVRHVVNQRLVWQNDTQYVRDLRAFISRQRILLDDLTTKLVNAGVLATEERLTARPSIAVSIADERSNRRSALPVLPDEPQVRMVK